MNRTIMKVVATPLAVMAALSALAPAVMAEGSWYSYISGGRPGFTSRTWTKNVNDGAATQIGHSSCDRNTATYALYKKQWWGSEQRNIIRYGCGWREHSMGSQDSGNYFFAITKIDGNSYIPTAGSVNVPSVWVKY
ncbi:hypothetical protein [Propioniciclava tarda]|uniref:Lactococcin 972 family bacteriocin n=1 Tax=Propioniciclava tarda TaxID=433330 RepID=A0A4Q9KHP7_PROTD|nr:hypothetical protein [Propioniciclava tarda]TBT91455.1 hypothetical protein ET996_13900 [Propioniciclava tarda]SMO86573.1 hypothetical protein SAMN06266982_1295 [Propioniciclava tarda]